MRSAAAKRRQAIGRKLAQIDKLLALPGGETLQPNQLAKLELGPALRRELAGLGASDRRRVAFAPQLEEQVIMVAARVTPSRISFAAGNEQQHGEDSPSTVPGSTKLSRGARAKLRRQQQQQQ